MKASKETIRKFVKLLPECPNLSELDMLKFCVTWQDFKQVVAGKAAFYVLEPQCYEGKPTLFDTNFEDVHGTALKELRGVLNDEYELAESSMFYSYNVEYASRVEFAVTGSGADPWLKIIPASLAHLQRVMKKVSPIKKVTPAKKKVAVAKKPTRCATHVKLIKGPRGGFYYLTKGGNKKYCKM